MTDKSVSAAQAESNPFPENEIPPKPVTYGAHAYTSILKPYMCRVGPRAGWTKFSDTELRDIINKHLKADGITPISRASYYRWKQQARDAGLLDFQSDSKRRRDRKRRQRGCWMTVLAVPDSVEWRTGRPRKKRETFLAPTTAKRETFDAHKRSPEKEQRSRGGSFVQTKSSALKNQDQEKTPSLREVFRKAKREQEQETELRWDSTASRFTGDRSKLRKAAQRYRDEFGERWVQAIWNDLQDYIEDNPNKAPRGDAFDFASRHFRREAKWRRMDIDRYQNDREETPAAKIERQSAQKWTRVGVGA